MASPVSAVSVSAHGFELEALTPENIGKSLKSYAPEEKCLEFGFIAALSLVESQVSFEHSDSKFDSLVSLSLEASKLNAFNLKVREEFLIFVLATLRPLGPLDAARIMPTRCRQHERGLVFIQDFHRVAPHLMHLNMSHTGISEAKLSHLASLRNLQFMDLSHNHLTVLPHILLV
jgi:Leucine-rich repeat (LRR) protein